MKIETHRQKILHELAACDGREKAIFALLSAERLRSCCWAHEVASKIKLTTFFEEVENLFNLFINGTLPEKNACNRVAQLLESLVPEGGEPLSVQAQSGVICLVTAFDMLANGGRTKMTDAINATIDASDNYEFFVRRKVKKDEHSPANHPLLLRELDRQILDAEFAKRSRSLQASAIIEYRIENLQFVIPPAV